MATDTITIEVDAQAAKAYRAADTDRRRKMELMVSLQLLDFTHDTRSLDEVMDEISDRAQARGMTPQVLKDILGEDKLEGCF